MYIYIQYIKTNVYIYIYIYTHNTYTHKLILLHPHFKTARKWRISGSSNLQKLV